MNIVTIPFNARALSLAATLCASALLAACGGGSDSAADGGSTESAAAAPAGDGWTMDELEANLASSDPNASDVFIEEQPKVEAAKGRSIKWHPGHYVVVGADAGARMIDRVLSETARFPWVRGIVIRVDWPDLERSKGNYNFATLDADVKRVQARNKRAFILVNTKSFSNKSAVPRYMRSGAYGGGAYKIRIKRGGYGENAALYNDKVAERLRALNQALANRYNRNPMVEGLIFNETALGMAVRKLSAAQERAQFENIARVNVAAKNAFSNTTVIQFMNSPMQHVPTLWRQMQANEVGVGGPDVYVNDKTTKKLLPYYNSAAGDVPIGVQVEPASYRSPMHAGPFNPPPVKQIFEYARDKMKANYMFWVPDESRPHNPWGDVRGMWSSGSFPKNATGGLRSGCPSGFNCGG
jgi:hypothetical protein